MTQNSSEDIGDSGEPNESYNSYSVDDEDQPQSGGDSLVDDRGLTEPLDEGYSPPEKWSVAEIPRRGASYQRQREVAAATGGDLVAVVDSVVRELHEP